MRCKRCLTDTTLVLSVLWNRRLFLCDQVTMSPGELRDYYDNNVVVNASRRRGSLVQVLRIFKAKGMVPPSPRSIVRSHGSTAKLRRGRQASTFRSIALT